MKTIGRRRMAAMAGAAMALPAIARAQATDKTLRVILPLGPGSSVDTSVRVLSDALGKALGQHVLIDNIPGVGGITGTAQLVRAAADGQTIAVISTNHVVNPSVYESVPFDAVNDITPITMIGTTPLVLLAHPSLPAKNIAELVALAKAKPGTINYGSSGNGTILHLAAEMLVGEADIKLQHIPYRAAGQLLQDLIGGQIQLCFFGINVAAAHVKSGKLRALGVSTARRAALMPDLPTIAEQGLANYALEGWFAAIGPARMKPADVARINGAFKAALAVPEIRDKLVGQGNAVGTTSPDETARFLRAELERYTRLVKRAGISLD